MEYIKQFEMNKIGSINMSKFLKRFIHVNGTFKKPYFTWNSFRPFSCLIYIVKKSYFQCQ
jgi:hypothetical protein